MDDSVARRQLIPSGGLGLRCRWENLSAGADGPVEKGNIGLEGAASIYKFDDLFKKFLHRAL